MVRILFAKNTACIVNKYKTLSRHKGDAETIDEFILDVLSKCKDSEIEILDNSARVQVMNENPKRDIERKIHDVLAGKRVSFLKMDSDSWNLMRTALRREAYKAATERAKEEVMNSASDPFA